MNATRRLFLQSAALSVIAANFPPSLLAQKSVNKPGRIFDPETLAIFEGVSPQTFERWIGSSFRVSLNNKSLGSLVLIGVDQPNSDAIPTPQTVRPGASVWKAASGAAVTTFSLHFQGSGMALPQETYMLSHDWLGTFPLFLVPSGLPGPRPTYTAVFTLLNGSEAKQPESKWPEAPVPEAKTAR